MPWWKAEETLRFRLWFAEPAAAEPEPNRSQWFWERMEPHLQHQPGGVGLLVDGRMAQAFVRDCAPDEPAVWTWGGRPGGTVSVPRTRTSIGFCTSAIVLPPAALSPVRTTVMTVGEALAARVGERRPMIDSDFDVFRVENRLVYVKEPCGEDDVAAPFFLHVFPVDPDDLRGSHRQHGFDNLDFGFHDRGQRFGGHCLAEVPLPDYGIATITTGQYIPGEGRVREGRFDIAGQVAEGEAAQ